MILMHKSRFWWIITYPRHWPHVPEGKKEDTLAVTPDPSRSRPTSMHSHTLSIRPTQAEIIAKRRREYNENMEEAATDLLAYFNHKNLDALLKVTRNTLESMKKRITSSSMVHYLGGKNTHWVPLWK